MLLVGIAFLLHSVFTVTLIWQSFITFKPMKPHAFCKIAGNENKYSFTYNILLYCFSTLSTFKNVITYKLNIIEVCFYLHYLQLLYLYNPKRAIRSSRQMFLQPRSWQKPRGDHAFPTAAPRLWNNLPVDISTSESNHVLKITFLLWLLNRTSLTIIRLAFYVCHLCCLLVCLVCKCFGF